MMILLIVPISTFQILGVGLVTYGLSNVYHGMLQANINGTLLLIPTPSEEKLTWRDSLNRCKNKDAVLYIPLSREEFVWMQSIVMDLGGYMWFPASDVYEEGNITTTEGISLDVEVMIWSLSPSSGGNVDWVDCVRIGKEGAGMGNCQDLLWPLICKYNQGSYELIGCLCIALGLLTITSAIILLYGLLQIRSLSLYIWKYLQTVILLMIFVILMIFIFYSFILHVLLLLLVMLATIYCIFIVHLYTLKVVDFEIRGMGKSNKISPKVNEDTDGAVNAMYNDYEHEKTVTADLNISIVGDMFQDSRGNLIESEKRVHSNQDGVDHTQTQMDMIGQVDQNSILSNISESNIVKLQNVSTENKLNKLKRNEKSGDDNTMQENDYQKKYVNEKNASDKNTFQNTKKKHHDNIISHISFIKENKPESDKNIDISNRDSFYGDQPINTALKSNYSKGKDDISFWSQTLPSYVQNYNENNIDDNRNSKNCENNINKEPQNISISTTTSTKTPQGINIVLADSKTKSNLNNKNEIHTNVNNQEHNISTPTSSIESNSTIGNELIHLTNSPSLDYTYENNNILSPKEKLLDTINTKEDSTSISGTSLHDDDDDLLTADGPINNTQIMHLHSNKVCTNTQNINFTVSFHNTQNNELIDITYKESLNHSSPSILENNNTENEVLQVNELDNENGMDYSTTVITYNDEIQENDHIRSLMQNNMLNTLPGIVPPYHTYTDELYEAYDKIINSNKNINLNCQDSYIYDTNNSDINSSKNNDMIYKNKLFKDEVSRYKEISKDKKNSHNFEGKKTKMKNKSLDEIDEAGNKFYYFDGKDDTFSFLSNRYYNGQNYYNASRNRLTRCISISARRSKIRIGSSIKKSPVNTVHNEG